MLQHCSLNDQLSHCQKAVNIIRNSNTETNDWNIIIVERFKIYGHQHSCRKQFKKYFFEALFLVQFCHQDCFTETRVFSLGFINRKNNILSIYIVCYFQEYMKMMGLSNWLHWTAWFTKYLLFLAISCIFMTIFFKIRVSSLEKTVFRHFVKPI